MIDPPSEWRSPDNVHLLKRYEPEVHPHRDRTSTSNSLLPPAATISFSLPRFRPDKDRIPSPTRKAHVRVSAPGRQIQTSCGRLAPAASTAWSDCGRDAFPFSVPAQPRNPPASFPVGRFL